MRASTARFAAAVAALFFVWLAATAWARPLLLPDEGRYVGVAWEMLRSGQWLTPTLDGLPYFHKPPLFYWITAGSLSIFGHHEWAARMAPLLGATVGATSLALFARRWAGTPVAIATLVAMMVQPLILIGGQFANLDMLVAGLITATITMLAHAALRAEAGEPDRTALIAAYATAALGVLAKGLIGAVLPVLVIGSWLILRRQWRILWSLVSWQGLVLFALLVVPWFWAMHTRFPAFLDYFFVVQHFKRFSEGGFNNIQPVWFFAAVLMLFFLPWLPWILASVRRLGAAAPGPHPVQLLMLVWVVVVTVFFSLPQSKLLGYILPAVAPLALLAADGYVGRKTQAALGRRLWLAAALIAVTLSTGLVIWLTVHHPKSSRALAEALAAQRHDGEPVIALYVYPFDVPFYARLSMPTTVVDDWSDPAVSARDNWRKELVDAGRFAAATAAADTLIEPQQLAARLCTSAVSWVIGASTSTSRFEFLKPSAVVYEGEGLSLWRVDARSDEQISALACQGKPSADSTSM